MILEKRIKERGRACMMRCTRVIQEYFKNRRRNVKMENTYSYIDESSVGFRWEIQRLNGNRGA